VRASPSSVFAFLILVVIPIWSRGARADAASSDVVVVVAGGGQDLLSVVAERVADAGGNPRITHADAIDFVAALTPPTTATVTPALAHVWLDFSDPERVTVLLLDQRFERGLVRYASRARGDEIAREEVGLMLEVAVRALRGGARIGLAREELLEKAGVAHTPAPAPSPPEPKLPKNAPPVEASPVWRPRLAATYAVDAFASTGAPVTHGPGLVFDVARPVVGGGVEIGGRLAAQARLPVDVRATPFTFGVEYWSLRVQASMGVALGPARRFWFQAATGAGLDIVHVVPESSTDRAGSLAASSDAVFPVARLGVGVAYRSVVRIAFWLTLDVDLKSVEYTYTAGTTPVALFAPFPARPGVTFELGTP
jgi:hypothetical protein